MNDLDSIHEKVFESGLASWGHVYQFYEWLLKNIAISIRKSWYYLLVSDRMLRASCLMLEMK